MTAKLYDLQTGELFKVFRSQSGAVRSVAFYQFENYDDLIAMVRDNLHIEPNQEELS